MVEPTDLSEVEASAFWFDVLRVGRAMQVAYRPLKMNYQLLGNGVPHLHWLVAPRFWEDVAPGGPCQRLGMSTFRRMRFVGMLRCCAASWQR